MCLYVSFPVGSFLLFNYPPFYEQAILDGRRALAASIDPDGAAILADFIKQQEAQEFEQTIKHLKTKKST